MSSLIVAHSLSSAIAFDFISTQHQPIIKSNHSTNLRAFAPLRETKEPKLNFTQKYATLKAVAILFPIICHLVEAFKTFLVTLSNYCG